MGAAAKAGMDAGWDCELITHESQNTEEVYAARLDMACAWRIFTAAFLAPAAVTPPPLFPPDARRGFYIILRS